MSNLFLKVSTVPPLTTYHMLAEFVPFLYYAISEHIFTYIFPQSELVLLEIICSCSYFLLDYENRIYVPFVETLDPSPQYKSQ